MTLEELIRQLARNAQAMRALLQTVSEEQGRWKPSPETWCLKEVMQHIYNEERLDFRKHLKEMLHDPPLPWELFRHEDHISVENLRQALEGFLVEREASILWLKALESPAWEKKSPTPFTSDGVAVSLSAGDVLVSWVAHDYLHLRQINELLYAWNEQKAKPFSVDYAGGW
jgi:hypothetical protein